MTKLKMKLEGPVDEETGFPRWEYEEYKEA